MADVAETIAVSSRRIGRHAWVESRLFETLGRWSGLVPDGRSRALFARQSQHHAWHAGLWKDLLPALPHLPDSELIVPDEHDAEVVAGLDALDGDDATAASARSTTARLAAVYGLVLPHLTTTYAVHLEHTTEVTDAPTRRVLRLVLADLADDQAAGDALIADLETADRA